MTTLSSENGAPDETFVNPFEPVGDDVGNGELLESLWAVGRALMDVHGLGEWELAYSNCAVDDLAYTDVIRRAIVLSAPMMVLIPGPERRETILHEIAHALCPPGELHGALWKETARRIGSTGNVRSFQSVDTQVFAPVVGECTMGHRIGYRRMPARTYRARMLCPSDEHGDDHRTRALTWIRQPDAIPADIREVIKRHSLPKPVAKYEPGDIVKVRQVGSEVDNMVAVIERVGRSNYGLLIPLPGDNCVAVMDAPFEGVEQVSDDEYADVAELLDACADLLESA